MKHLLLLLFCPTFLFSQTQMGNDIDGEAVGDYLGTRVSLSSDGLIMAIGAALSDGNGTDSGHVRVYENVGGVWTQIGDDIDGEVADDRSGISLSLSSDGSVLAIGAVLNDGNGNDSGHVRIYENIAGVWTQIGNDIDGEAAGDLSGYSVSLSADGSVVAIGAPNNNVGQRGHVRVYENESGVWTQVGGDIDGEFNDYFGKSVSLSSDGSILAIGAALIGSVGANRNAAYRLDSNYVSVYENILGVWTQIGSDINGEEFGDMLGTSVSLSSDGTVLAAGAVLNNGASGYVKVYENISGVWIQVGDDIDGEASGDWSGVNVSLSSNGSVVAIGAVNNDGNGNNSGHVRVYKNVSGIWTQAGVDIDGEEAGDWSGNSVNLSSSGFLAVGAPLNDGNGNDSGHVRVYDLNEIISINDECIDAVALTLGETLETTNVLATASSEIPACNDTDRVDVWFTFNTETATSVDIMASDGYNLQLWSGTCGALTQVSGACASNILEDIALATATVYYLQVWSCSSCRRVTGLFDILVQDGALSTQDFALEDLAMYPNPTSDILNLIAAHTITSIQVYNILGQEIFNSQPNALTDEIDMSGFNSGLYLIEVEINNRSKIFRIIKD